MQTSQQYLMSPSIHDLYGQPVRGLEPFYVSGFQILDNNASPEIGSHGTPLSFQIYKDQFYTLDSSSTAVSFMAYDSPSTLSVNSRRSPFSPQGSHSSQSALFHSPDNAYGSPLSGSSSVADKLREIEVSLFGPESEITDASDSYFTNGVTPGAASVANLNEDQLMEMVPRLDLKQVLLACSLAVSEGDYITAAGLMRILEKMVSVSGEPIQRLGAYMLEGLRARLESSGSIIYKALRCQEPTSSELMSYMTILFQICPYWKFAYTSANVVIKEAMENEPIIHIIDFQIAQGTQWMYLMAELTKRPGRCPLVRITGIDDTQSNLARGGGLHMVGERLAKFAQERNIPFEFHDASISSCEVQVEHLTVQPGEAIAVNFPYVLHHMPDESVDTSNHRDRLLRLVKSLSPKVMTLVEQESNTNTSPFFHRFNETLDYYTAMFESIDASPHSRDDKQRISAEQNCVARDIVNMIACEGAERVERHEVLGKWRSRLTMAGFTQCSLSSSVTAAVTDLLKEFDRNYRVVAKNGALYLGWMNRAMATSSAWR